MLVCKDCGRYYVNQYDKCPGCGSTNLAHEETKYSFLVEKTPKEGYLLAKNLIDFKYKNPKSKKRAVVTTVFLLLIFLGVLIFVLLQFNNPDDMVAVLPLLIGMVVVFGLLALVAKAVPSHNNLIVKLYKEGVLYKNVPYKLEKYGSLAFIVVYVDINGEQSRKFRQPVNTDAQMIEDEGYIDLLVNPKDPLIFFMAEDIY